MTTVLLVGAGATGARAARQLADTTGLTSLLVADREPSRAAALAAAVGPIATTVALDRPFPEGVDAVAAAVPARAGALIARRALDAGASTAAIADDRDGIAALLGLDAAARANGVLVAVGCGLVPGLGDVLARHAADAFDRVDEAHVARVGAGGSACVAALRRARREPPLEWLDEAWHTPPRRGHELVWFPDPVGARECESVAPGVELLRDSVPGLRTATVRVGEAPPRNAALAILRRRAIDDGWGGAHVEVWGWRGRVARHGRVRRDRTPGRRRGHRARGDHGPAGRAAPCRRAARPDTGCPGARRDRRPGALPWRARTTRREGRGVRRSCGRVRRHVVGFVTKDRATSEPSLAGTMDG